jgi:uncharacterized protein
MLSFDIRSLEAKAVVVDDEFDPTDPAWQFGDPLPLGSLHVSGRLSAAGSGRFYWHGRVEGEVSVGCRRCLVETQVHVSDEAHLIFAQPEDEDTEDTDDPDVYQLDPRVGELDLRPAIREQWLLAVPGYALCREDCKGLCPRCGADLNTQACACTPAIDSRWNALHKAGN